MPNSQIKAVLFDLGETLLNFGRFNSIELIRQGARLSYDFLKSCGQPVGNFNYYYWQSVIHLRIRDLFSSITGKDFDALSLFKKIGTKKGIRLSEQQWRHFAWLWYKPLSKVAQIEPKTKETLAALKEKGLKLGIVSNTFVHSSSLEKHLERLGILSFFSVRMYSYEFRFRKPDARIFQTAAERIGEKPVNIVFVGDRLDKDIKPAIKAGMHAVVKTAYTNTGERLPEGVWKISRLCELPGLIERIRE